MIKNNLQEKLWSGQFGNDYTKRSSLSAGEMEKIYEKNYGIKGSLLIKEFLSNFPKSAKILEVGANVGAQLALFKKLGYKNLYGIEINKQAIRIAKEKRPEIDIIFGSAQDIPFKSGYFDLVFTVGVLIHIAPENIKAVMNEIARCSKKYIWGLEYFAEEHQGIDYRNEKGLLWKGNFPEIYLKNIKNLQVIKQRKLPYLKTKDIDIMYLIQKNE